MGHRQQIVMDASPCPAGRSGAAHGHLSVWLGVLHWQVRCLLDLDKSWKEVEGTAIAHEGS